LRAFVSKKCQDLEVLVQNPTNCMAEIGFSAQVSDWYQDRKDELFS